MTSTVTLDMEAYDEATLNIDLALSLLRLVIEHLDETPNLHNGLYAAMRMLKESYEKLTV